MALEALLCQLDPLNSLFSDIPNPQFLQSIWDQSPPSSAHNINSSPEDHASFVYSPPPPPPPPCRRKRRRAKTLKNKEEMENQRMTHIAVERNRRRQMNDYLAVLRSLMPPSYAQRGDQASIVGGAINFVKELEQLLQFLESKKLINQENNLDALSNFFTFPQYSMRRSLNSPEAGDSSAAEQPSSVAEIEVTMVESHANIKMLSKKRPKQLLKMVAGLQALGLTILHLNITTVDSSVLFSFSVKVEEECQLSTVNEIASAVHNLVGITTS